MTLEPFTLCANHRGARRGWLAACLLLVAACPGKDGLLTDYSFNTDGSTTDGATATGATTEISATATTTTGEPDVCEDPAEEVVGPTVTVTVRNAGAADIFVRGHGFCGDPIFTVNDADDDPLITWIGADCPPSCSVVLQHGECGCNDIGCAPGVVKIAPGGAFVDSWSGGRFDIIQPPAACVPESCVGQSCSVRRQTEPGTYTVAAHANSAFVCTIGDCACEPGAEGWCVVPDVELDPVATVAAELHYPDDGAVELVFE